MCDAPKFCRSMAGESNYTALSLINRVFFQRDAQCHAWVNDIRSVLDKLRSKAWSTDRANRRTGVNRSNSSNHVSTDVDCKKS